MTIVVRWRLPLLVWLGAGCVGVWVAVTRLWAGAPGWLYGADLVAYVNGAARLNSVGSPYHPLMLEVVIANDPASVGLAYLYPPPLAQLFTLLPPLDRITLATVWVAVQVVLLVLILPAVARRYAPAAGSIERLAVVLAFAATSYPLSFALYGGNVSGWVAIGVALLLLGGGATRGIVAAGLTLLKAVPIPFLLIALASRPSRLPAAVTIVGGLAVSFIAAPQAWAEWLRAWPHIAAMTPGAAPWNLSPTVAAAQVGAESIGRVAGVALTLGFAAIGVLLAFRDRWPAAVAAATTATLFVSPTLWDHYLAATVPLVIAAWWVARPLERAVLVGAWLALMAMWYMPNEEVFAVIWLVALLVTSVTTIRALGRVAPKSTVGMPTRRDPADGGGRDVTAAESERWELARAGSEVPSEEELPQ